MPRATVSVQNFASGELTPKLRGRYDLALFRNGAERMQNFISEIQGPARYRAGFRHVAQTRHNLPARLIPFIYNETNSYICEFTVGAIRFYASEGLVIDSTETITGVTQANPAVVTTSGSHGYSNGDEVIISGIVGMTELNGKTYRVANVTATTFEIQDVEGNNINSSGFTAYSSGGTSQHIFSVSNPYTTIDEIFELEYAQSADVVYYVHPSFAPRKLIRTGATAFTFGTFSRTADPFGVGDYPRAVTIYQQRIYYAGTNNDPLKLFGSQAGNFDDMTVGTSDDDGFTFTIASKKISRINALSSNNKFLAVLSDGGNKSVTGGNESAITPTNIKIDDADFLGSDRVTPLTKDNLIMFVQQGKRKLRALQYSFEQDGYQPENMNSISDHITKSGIKEIAYQEGSPDAIWCVREDGVLLGLTIAKVENIMGWHRHTTGGDSDKFYSVASIPRNIDYDQLYAVVQRPVSGSTKYFVEFLEDEQEWPEYVDYFSGSKSTDESNYLLALYEAQKRGMYLDAGATYDGSSQSFTITPSATTGTGITFTASGTLFTSADINRQIWERNGTGRAKITGFTSGTQVTCTILSDFASTNAIAAGDWYFTASQITGLDHLEGRAVQVVTDGAVHPDKTVSDGAITLDYQSSYVNVGLQYTGLIISNNVEGGGANGPSQTKIKNVHKLGIRFSNTLGTEYGTDLYKLEKILFRNTNSFTNRPPPLFSGDRVFPVKDSYKREKKLYIRQEKPLPCSIQLLMVYLNTSED